MNPRERGSALVIAVLVLALLSSIGLALLFMSENELKLGRADLRGKLTFYVAEAGLEHARLALFDANGKDAFDEELLDAAGGTVDDIELDVDSLAPTYDAAGILTGFASGYGDDVPLLGATSFGEGAYVAFLTNDPVDGIEATTDTNDRVMITAVGGTIGNSLETVQAIIEYDPLLPTMPSAAVALLGPSPSWTPGTSAAKLYSGDDCNGAGEPGVYVPSVGLLSDPAVADVQAALGTPTYQAGALAPVDTIANLNDTSHPAVVEPPDPIWQDCQLLHDFVELLRTKATLVCASAGSCSLPAPSLSNFVFVDDDFTLGPADGAGLIVVTGTVTFNGNFAWDGIILAVGEGTIRRNGGGAEDLSGTVVVADVAGADDIYGNSDDCGSGFDPPVWDTAGGGNSLVTFCGADVVDATPHEVYRIVEFLQR